MKTIRLLRAGPGRLAVTGNAFHRAGAGIPLTHATPVPFGKSLDSDGQVPDFQWLEQLLGDPGSGLDAPAKGLAWQRIAGVLVQVQMERRRCCGNSLSLSQGCMKPAIPGLHACP